ncbi:MAG: hypothetical protein GX076_07505 [Clostridiales bacterium]|nr:hypothetical protein [Clostridiales bacterium]
MNITIKGKVPPKAIIGVVILVIALALFLLKEPEKDDLIEISESDSIIDEKLEEGDLETTPVIQETIVVELAGEVNNPSVYILTKGSRVYEAIELAGGLTEEADTRNTNLAAILQDEMKIYIPSKEEVKAMEEQSGTKAGSDYIGGNTTANSSNQNKNSKVNLNTANSIQLQQLRGVGPSTAEKIIEYRNKHGRFNKIEDIMNVSGIGEKTFENLKNFITVE